MIAKIKQNFYVDGVEYPKGPAVELPDSLAKHWFFKGLVAEGKAEVIKAPAAAKPAAPAKKPAQAAAPKPPQSKPAEKPAASTATDKKGLDSKEG